VLHRFHWLGLKLSSSMLRSSRTVEFFRAATGMPLCRTTLSVSCIEWPRCILQQQAFELAAVSRTTPTPPGGAIRQRRQNGDLQGYVAEDGRKVFAHAGKREQLSPEQQRQRSQKALAYGSKLLTAVGTDHGHDAAASEDKIRAYQDSRAAGGTVAPCVRIAHRFHGERRLSKTARSGRVYGTGDEHVRIGAAKFVADGSASERTMRMNTPYVGKPTDYAFSAWTRSKPTRPSKTLTARLEVAIHANGDVAIDMVLNAYEQVLKEWPRPGRRHRIGALHIGQSEFACPYQGDWLNPHAILDVRVLPRREVARLWRREACNGCLRTSPFWTRAFG